MKEIRPVEPSVFEQTAGLEDWRVLGEGASIYVLTASFGESARLVQALGQLPGVDDHPPAVDVREGGVTIRLVSRSAEHYGMSELDVQLAGRISQLVGELGLTADPSRLQYLLVIPGAPDIAKVTPFWRALLGYEPRPDSPEEDLVDPQDRGPGFWFETMDEPRAGGGGAIHVAVWLPQEQAEARVAAALEAGGRMVRNDYAPSWWTLADAAGNEADISTIRERE